MSNLLFTKIRSYRSSWSSLQRIEKYLCIEILFFSLVSKIEIHMLPFERFAKSFGRITDEREVRNFHPLDENELRVILTLLNKLSKILPWNAKCLLKVHTASKMLRRRNQAFRTIFGVKPSVGSSFPLNAHVWIEINDDIGLENPIDDPLQIIANYVYDNN